MGNEISLPPIDGENNPSVTKAISQVISELNSIFNSHTCSEEYEYLLSFAVGLNETITGIKDAITLISNNSPSTPVQIQNIISSIALLNETLNNHKLSNNVNISNLQSALESLSTIVRRLETNLRGVDIATLTDAITNIDNTLNSILTTLVEKVNTSRTINNKPLTEDIILTKDDINLSNVDNTSDVNKPLSLATREALDLKINKQTSITPKTVGDSSSIPVITYNSDGVITSSSTVDILVTPTNVGLENVVNVDTTKTSAITLDVPLDSNECNTINVGDILPTVISKLDNKITDTVANKMDIVSSSTLNSIPVFDELGQLKDSLMKFNDFGSSDTDILSAKAIKQEILSKVTGLLDLRGNYNIADGDCMTEDGKMIRRYPYTGGSGVDGMILKGDLWYIIIPDNDSGYIGEREVNNGDSVFALVDNPGDLDSQWGVISSAIGYAPEDSSNKTNTLLVESDTLYPTTGLVKTYVDSVLTTKENSIPPGLPNQFLSGDKTWTTINSKTLGLDNVLNVEQLKRSGGDWISMVGKSSPSSNDLILIEDSTDIYSKKKITINSLPISSAVNDALTTFIPSSRTVNSKPLSTNITLTKDDIGLSNVDNTSDLLKPLSNAAVSSLSQKVDKINLPSGDTVGSSHQVPQITYNTQGQITSVTPIAISLTPSDVGLSNLTNIDTTDLSNINLNGSITLSSDQVVSGDSGKVIVEKLQGQINDRVEKLSPPRENAILVSNTEGNLIDSGKVFNDEGTTSNDILSASAINDLLLNFGGLGGLEYVDDFTPLADGTYPDGLPTKKGQLWKVINDGAVGSIELKIGDLIVAKEDIINNNEDGESNNYILNNNDSNNWLHIQGVLGYTAENIANRENIISPTANNRYPTSKAVCDYVINSISDVRSVPSDGATTEYLRGDNTWQELTKDSVGLSNVTNSSQVTREPDFNTFDTVTSISPSDIALIESISTDGLKKHIKFEDIITSITDAINTNSTLDKLSDVNMDSPLNNYQSLVYDSTTSKWTNKMSSAEYIPIGTITSYFGVTAPTGWLMCDGSSFNQLVYNDLYTLLGTNVVPDLRGYFLRGLDNTGTVDIDGAGRALGSVQSDSFKSHTHTSNATGLPGEYGIIRRSTVGENTTPSGTDDQGSGIEPSITYQPIALNINSTGSNETRPKNVAVNFIIKAKKVGDPTYIGGFSLQGSWDAETNTPTLTSGVGTNGYYYIVSNSGTANINGVSSFWTKGDWVIFTGSNWERLATVGGITVNTVNGYVGDVMIDKTSVGLSEVDNTSDINKPISTLVYSALETKQSISGKDVPNGYSGLDSNGKIPLSNIPDIELNNLSDTTITNPLIKDVLIYDNGWSNRNLTPSDVGLSNVTNSSQIKRSLDFDTFLYKPVLNDTDKFLVEDNDSKNYTTFLDIKTSVTNNSMSKVQGNTTNSIAILDSNGSVISSEIQISNDPTLEANSSTLIPTQNAVVEYVASTAIASIKRGVRAISVIPIDLITISPGVLQTSYPLIVDGVSIETVEDDILLIAQSNPAQNGIYEIIEIDTTAQTISMRRCMCNDGTAGLQPGAITAIIEGAEYQGSIFYQVTEVITLEEDPIEYMIINTGVGNLKSINNLSELTPTASIVRSNLSAAASGNNTDIKSLKLDYNGLKINNETSSYHTTIVNNSTLTDNRNLHIITEDHNTTLSLIGNTTTLSGINSGDETKESIQSKLSVATSSNDGYLTASDWVTFNNKESVSNKGQPGGYPSLDAQGKISSTQLPELPNISDLKDVVLTLPLVEDQSITYDSVTGKWINRGSSANGEFIPIGTISSYFGLTAPDSWLLCNGSTFSQTTYPDLYNLLGTDVVPDLRGYFLRGLDTGKLRDQETRGLGSVQADSYKSHTHGHNGTSTTGLVTQTIQSSGLVDETSNTTGSIDIQSSPTPLVISNAGGVETRPKNVAVNFIIKAKKSAKTVMLPFFSAEGSWDAETNTPTITSSQGTNGSYYIVSVAGTTTIDGNDIWNEGDWIIFTGTRWEKISNSQQLSRGSNDYTKFPSKSVLSSNDVVLIEDSNSEGSKKYSTVSAIRNRGALSSVNFYPTDQRDIRDYIISIASPYMHQGNEIIRMSNYINMTQGISGSMCYSKYHDSIVYLTLDAIISINPYTKESSYILHGVDFSSYDYPISDAALHRPTNRIYYSGLEMVSSSIYMSQNGSIVSFTLPNQVSYNAVVYNGTNQCVYYIPKDVITEWPYINSVGSVNTFSTDVSYTSDEFVDGIYCPVNNRIYLIPGNNINNGNDGNDGNDGSLYYIDCSTNTIMSYTYNTTISVGLKSVSAVYTPVNNRIYLIPQNVLYGTWYYIDCSTNSIIGYSVMNIGSYTGNAVGCTYVPILNRIYIGNGMLESQYLYIDCFKDEVNMYAPIDEPAYGSGRGDGIYSMGSIYFPPTETLTVNTRMDLKINDSLPSYVSITLP